MDAGGVDARQPALRANLQRALAMEAGGIRCAVVLAQYPGARRAKHGGRYGCLWVCLVCVRTGARLRADRRRTAADHHVVATLARLFRSGPTPGRVRCGTAVDDP